MTTNTAFAVKKTSALPNKVRVPRRVSLENYLEREAHSIEKHEFINGKIVRIPGGKAKHNQIAAQLTSALIVATEDFNPIFIVYNSDMKIYY